MNQRIKNVQLLDPSTGRFLILDRIEVRLPGPLWWHAEDIEGETARGIMFRGYRESDETEKAYLIVVDVSADPTEPDISRLSQGDVGAVDAQLQREFASQSADLNLTLVRWMRSHLNETETLRMLVTAYIASDPDVGDRQFVAGRFSHGDRKMVMMVCFNVAEADELASPIFNILRQAVLRKVH